LWMLPPFIMKLLPKYTSTPEAYLSLSATFVLPLIEPPFIIKKLSFLADITPLLLSIKPTRWTPFSSVRLAPFHTLNINPTEDSFIER